MSGIKASLRATATGQMLATPAIVHGLHYAGTGTAGRITVRDGGATESVLIDIDSAASAGDQNVGFEGGGVYFNTNVHLSSLSNIDAVTLFYQDR